jgi:hypothetical protein
VPLLYYSWLYPYIPEELLKISQCCDLSCIMSLFDETAEIEPVYDVVKLIKFTLMVL